MVDISDNKRQVSILVPDGASYENVFPKTVASAVDTSTENVTVQDHIDDTSIHVPSTTIDTKISTALNDYTPTADLAAVALSNSYNDLDNKPTIGSATITIQKNSTKVDDFSVNATTNKSINISVPVNVTDLADASSYYTSAQVDSAIATAVSSVYRYKGSVATYSLLPKTGNVAGDVYNVEDTGANYAWTGSVWDKLSDDLTNYVTLNGTQTLKNKTIAIADNTITGLATVATTGAYSDLTGTPTVGDATLTITRNNVSAGTFTANATANKSINIAVPTTVAELSDSANYALNADLAAVAKSGSYTDLEDKPTIGSATITIQKNGTKVDDFSVNATTSKNINVTVPTTVGELSDASDYTLNADLAAVAKSGLYSDLSGTPTIGDATLTIKRNNTTVDTFKANATTDKSINIAVPTTVAELSDSANYALVSSLAAVATSGSYTDLDDKPTIGTATLTIQKNSVDVATFGANATTGVTANIAVPTAVAELSDSANYALVADLATVATSGAYSDLSGTPTKLSDFTDDLGSSPTHTHSQYVQTSDITSTYSSTGTAPVNGKAVASAISSKQNTIDSTHKLSSDLVDDSGHTNKFVTTSEKSTWNGKQDAISDLATIRSGASAGATALQPNAAITGATKCKITYDANGLVTAGDDLIASDIPDISATYQTKITSTNKVAASNISGLAAVATSGNASDLTQSASYRFVSDTEKSTWNGKQDAISDLATIRSGAEAGATALQQSDVSSTYSSTGTAPVNGTAVASAISGKADTATSLSGYGITDAYTKTEIDGKLSGAMHFKGTKAKVSDLPASGNTTGDMWNVQSTGANYAWDGSVWDKLSENIDLSGYVPTSRTINGKALSGDISLTAGDVGAMSASAEIPTITDTYSATSSDGMSGKAVASAISTKQDTLSSTNKLTASYINQTSSYRFVSDTEKSTWNGKQDTISDLATIRSGAEAGATALQQSDVTDTYSSTGTAPVNGKAVASAISTKQDTIDSSHKLSADLLSEGTTNKLVSASEKSTWNGKQDAISDLATIRSGAEAGATALQQSDVTDTYSSTGTAPVNGKAIASAISGKADSSDLANYVPTSRTINSKALTANISLTASDVGAAASSHNQASNTINLMTGYSKAAGTATGIVATDTLNVALAKIEQVLDTKQGGGSYVPTSRTINSKALSSDITLTASDVGALPDSTVIPTITDTYSATSSNGMSGKAVASAISGKQDAISDLATIRSGAEAGATALQQSDVSSTYSSTGTAPVNGKAVASAISGKQNTISDLATIRSGASAGATALQQSDVTDTYSSTGTAPVNGKAVASAISGKADSSDLANYVPTSRTVNGKALTANITLSASDVSALPSSTVIPTITDTYSATSSNGMSGKAVASAISNKADTATSLSGYGITDAYTKTEIDGKLSGAMHFKGTKASASALPSTGNTQGDMWNVSDTGANYAWDGSAWDKLSENIDLSGYVPTSRTVNGKALSGNISLTASDVGALADSTVIPTITDTYSSTSSDGMSGKAVASAISGKQDTISDLATIRSGASAGATALQPNASITAATKCKITYDANGLVTAGADLIASDIPDLSATYQTKITSSAKLSADLLSEGTTNKLVSASEKSTWNGKQDALVSGTNIKTVNGSSLLGTGDITIDSLPAQAGNSGKFLGTNGTAASWNSLPIASTSSTGVVKADGTTITVDSAGTISAVQDTMTMVVDEFTMAADGTTISLTNAPASKSLCWVNICNTDIVSSEWSLSGSTITLATSIPAGTWGQVRYFTNVGGVSATSPLLKTKASVSAGALTLQASKKFYEATVNGNTTFTITAPSTSDVIEFYLHITHTSGTITFPSSVKWASTPSFTAGKKHLIKMLSFDGGSTYLAQLEGSF